MQDILNHDKHSKPTSKIHSVNETPRAVRQLLSQTLEVAQRSSMLGSIHDTQVEKQSIQNRLMEQILNMDSARDRARIRIGN